MNTLALQYADMLPGYASMCQLQSSAFPAMPMYEFDIVDLSFVCKVIALHCSFFKI